MDNLHQLLRHSNLPLEHFLDVLEECIRHHCYSQSLVLPQPLVSSHSAQAVEGSVENTGVEVLM